jgi:signal transduction histidine kinase/ligand-binding sensor domain-containing protein/DNA-binding response OmpR family regulator
MSLSLYLQAMRVHRTSKPKQSFQTIHSLLQNYKHMKKWSIIFCIFLLFTVLTLHAQEQQMQFKHFNINNGLSSNQVRTVFEDSRGFIWIGTIHGLNRFDGYSNKVFLKAKNDTNSLSDNSINHIYEAYDGKLWIETASGLVIFNHETEHFSTDDPLFHKNIPLPRTGFVNMFVDDQGDFWLIHNLDGMYKYNPESDLITHYETGKELMPYSIGAVSSDTDGNIWIINSMPAIEVFNPKKQVVERRYIEPLNLLPKTTNQFNFHVDAEKNAWIYIVSDEKGVFHLNTTTEELTHYNSRSSSHRISHDNISTIISDHKGNVLIGSDHGGLNLIEKETGKIIVYGYAFTDKNSLSQNSITCLLRDSNNIIWIGTYKKGINYYHPDLFKFSTYTLNPLRDDWLSTEDVNTFAEDENGNLWVGTNGGGLMYFDRKKENFKIYRNNPNDMYSISSDVVVDLCIDHEGGLWIGTYTGGLNYFDGKRFIRYMHDPNDSTSIPNNNVWAIHEDSDRTLWVGTLNNGITVFNRKNKSFEYFKSGSQNLHDTEFIMAIAERKNRDLWFATTTGILMFDKATSEFDHFYYDQNPDNSLSNNSTLDIYCDSRDLVWIATREGLNMYNPEKNIFEVFGTEHGLPDEIIITILEDKEHNLWVATQQGLSNLIISFDNENGQLTFNAKTYTEKDGLHGKEFNEHAALKTRSGELIFGGSDGFSIFNPENLSTVLYNPKVFLSELKVQNKVIGAGQTIKQRVLMNKALHYTKNISLKHFEKTFSVSFSAINYINPEKTLFHYKLEGFNEEWTTTGPNVRELTYTNLNPGDYTLKVFVSDIENALQSDVESLTITILPPFWKTKWAYSAYLVLFLFAVFLLIRVFINRERNKFLLKQERIETARQHEMDMLKLKFFTNISHEFRTPLTLIISPIERLKKLVSDKEHKEQLQLIHRNARRLLTLVNQLLDFRRLEVQGLSLEVSEGELVSFCREAVESFSDMSETRDIQLTFCAGVAELYARYDYDKIEKIIFNLLSNAFKFTPENGSISFNLDVDENRQHGKVVKFEVKDTGIGIPEEKQDLIFERFVQSIPQGISVSKGSGIGLSLTREFVQMHEGLITVNSEPGKGSCFTVVLPLKDKFKLQQVSNNAISDEIIAAGNKTENINKAEKGSFKLLLVEDNPDIRFYLKDNLSADYKVFEAANGDKAWEIIPDLQPDLIVCDIMMPGMDGIELCKRIKTDSRTSHIPVILLTARTSDQHRYEGFETGADDYITKPFNFELLQLRIAKLIEQRKHARKQFQKNFDINPSEINITSLDEKFLGKVKELTESNMQEPDFSVEKLSREIGISRAHLYNKLLALTGKTPIEYIRIMRIRRAAQLLEKSQLTVMEVAYKVGFNDPRYFTKHFKNEYKMTPTQYIKKHLN